MNNNDLEVENQNKNDLYVENRNNNDLVVENRNNSKSLFSLNTFKFKYFRAIKLDLDLSVSSLVTPN